MENPLNNLLSNIVNYFIKSPPNAKIENNGKVLSLIRIHNEQLFKQGDVSFPCKIEIWQKYFPPSSCLFNEESFQLSSGNNEKVECEKLKFLEMTKQWLFPVHHLNIKQERCHLHLQRNIIIKYIIPQAIQNSKYGHLKTNASRKVYLNKLNVSESHQRNLVVLRSQLVCNVLEKLLDYSGWEVVPENDCKSNENACLVLNVGSVTSMSNRTGINFKCGPVNDPAFGGKLCPLTAQMYIGLRSNDMTLMALHKYGIRIKQDVRFIAQMERLGAAAVTVDLLEIKHTSPVKVVRNNQGSTKGASFILYNSARLESMLNTFQKRIVEGEYEPLPKVDEIQWNLLNEEEEWQLVYVYIAGFPELIERCVQQLDRGLCATHLIIRFLHGLVAIFSVYYQRIRVLMEKRDHLMPYVYARIYLIKAVREILNKTMALLDIEPVEFM